MRLEIVKKRKNTIRRRGAERIECCWHQEEKEEEAKATINQETKWFGRRVLADAAERMVGLFVVHLGAWGTGEQIECCPNAVAVMRAIAGTLVDGAGAEKKRVDSHPGRWCRG